MADTLTTISVLDNMVGAYYDKRLMARLTTKVKFYQFAEKRNIPKNAGNTIYFNAFTNFTPATGALTEGTNPDLKALSSRRVSAVLAQYGRGIKVTDIVDMTAVVPVVQNAVDVLADSLAETVDRVVQTGIFKDSLGTTNYGATTILSALISATASAFSKNTGTLDEKQFQLPAIFGTSASRLSAVDSGANQSVSSRLSTYSLRKTIKKLQVLNALPFADGYYKGITRPEQLSELQKDSTWKEWYQYVGARDIADRGIWEEGKTAMVKFYSTTNMPRYAVAAHSVGFVVIFGQGCFGVTELAGAGKPRIYIKRPGANSTENPIDLYSTVAYKATMAAATLNPSAGRVLCVHFNA